ncbi:MAG: hypothetical protein HRU02_15930 [Myxococcales bacterium]|nr:hypothetical protein [Myxococcales bacterium]
MHRRRPASDSLGRAAVDARALDATLCVREVVVYPVLRDVESIGDADSGLQAPPRRHERA